MNRRSLLNLFLVAALLLGLPALGAWLAGFPLERYLEFPPISRYREPAAFSWPAFAVLAVIEGVFYAPVAAWLRAVRCSPGFAFPRWGWVAVLWTVAWWILAWTRIPWFAPFQQHTFTPLWLGYIGAINALTHARTGRCLLTHAPRRLLALFAASAGFWWFFEYLNRFVQNWYYEGIADLGPLRYLLFATPAFATVLPAVLSTADLLTSLTPAGALTRCSVRLPPATRIRAWLLLLTACAGLAGIGVWPDFLYPLLWIAPLLLLTAFRQWRGDATVFTPAEHGNWQRIAVLMAAALVCGFFWEMWNFFSFARWIYQVPFVGRFHVFEMPLLGFAGYLPFGLECAVIADALVRPPRNGSPTPEEVR